MERGDQHSARLDEELKHETLGMVQAGDHATRVEELAGLPQGERFANVQQVMTTGGFSAEEHGY